MTGNSRAEGGVLLDAATVHKGHGTRPQAIGPWRKFMALAVVGIMVLTGFTVLGKAVHNNAPAQAEVEQPEPAKVLAGAREATYTIDHMFELYQKSHDPADLGRWNGTMGLNEWWQLRAGYYQQYPARQEFPFVMVYDAFPWFWDDNPEDPGNAISTWYRMTIDAKNLAEIADGPNLDPIFTPVLGDMSTPGAYVNISWYSTYLEPWEVVAISAGTHYANTYYGVPANVTPKPPTDDGFYHELQGKLTFNRAAAAKILDLAGAEDLRTQFDASDHEITAAWKNDWMVEGGPNGAYDIYTAYDYSLQIPWLELSLDPASTADDLVLRFWSVSWGNEALLIRYMEAANVQRYLQGWPDDWYLNISIAPDGGNVHSRAVIGYHMYATKDYLNNINGWALEASHIDCHGNSGNHNWYLSPYNAYDHFQTDVTHISWAPLTVNYGKPVWYIRPPLHWNLTAGEKIVVKLPGSKSLPGYFPQASESDILGTPKIAEMAGNVTWGEMVAGNGYPYSGVNNLKNFYDKATKTYTVVGPKSFAVNYNPAFPNILNSGAPMFVMNVMQTYTMNLTTGWNLVSLPLVGYGYKASTLGLLNGDTVSTWNPPYRTYTSHVVGIPTNDFAIIPGKGYWINVPAGARSLTIYGVVPNAVQTIAIDVPPGGGWALIGFVGLNNHWNARDIPGLCNASVTMIAKWNPATKSYTNWLPGIPTINNFGIVPGAGYWILVSQDCVITYYPH